MSNSACQGDDNNKYTDSINLRFISEVPDKRINDEWHTDKKEKKAARYDTIYCNEIMVLLHLLLRSILLGESIREEVYILNRYLDLILEQNHWGREISR